MGNKFSYGQTPLLTAVRYSNTDSSFQTVKHLVDNKANLDLQNKNGNTAVMIASRYSNTDSSFQTVKHLVDNKANLDLQNKNGWTALNLISDQPKMFGVIKYLLENGSETKSYDNNGKTFWDNLLLEYKRKLNNNQLIEGKIYSNTECSICLEEMIDKRITTRCGHMFHIGCIVLCNNKCPLCRGEL